MAPAPDEASAEERGVTAGLDLTATIRPARGDGPADERGETAGLDVTATIRPGTPQAERWIGPYRLVRELGHGGMGTVFLAVRADAQFEKRVAIKVVRGPDTEEVLRYFRRERQILAGLEHPNIARLLDGGTTDDGLPYLVMEYVEGERIDRYCDERKLGIRERLTLFQGVFAAVQSAHRSLVVHRDLKPANILVTAEGAPKLLDFGIAKLLSPMAGGAGDTVAGMTPDYASPEQARGRPITTATDVYSLGVILYELLTGHRPYRLKTTEPMEVLKAVCEEEPQAPSTAVLRTSERRGEDGTTTTTTPEETSRLREDSPQRLRRSLQGDLDAIVLTALQKEPARRYDSVEAFSQDIGRYLEGRPVKARKASGLYRFRKLAQRHTLAFTASAVSVLLLIVLATAMTVAAGRLRRERDRVAAENAKVTAMNAFLEDALGAANPWEQGSRSVTLVDALSLAQSKAETTFRDQPLIRAAVLQTIGTTFTNLTNFPDGEKVLRESLDLRVANAGPRSVEAASSMESLSDLYRWWRKLDVSEGFAREALAIHREVDGARSLRTASAADLLAQTLVLEGKAEEAKALAEEILKIARSAPRPPPGKALRASEDPVLVENLALSRFFGLALREGDFKTAETLGRQRLELLRKHQSRRTPELAVALNDLGQAQYFLRAYAEAEQNYREALAMDLEFFGEEHPEVAVVRENLAGVYGGMGRFGETETLLRSVLAVRRKMLGDDSEPAARTRANLARNYMKAGRFAEAETEYRQALPVMDAKSDPLDAAYVRFRMGEVLHKLGKLDEADAVLRSSLEIRAKALGDANEATQAVFLELVAVSMDRGKPEEAAAFRAKLAPPTK